MNTATSIYIYNLISACFVLTAIIVILNLRNLISACKPSKTIHLVFLSLLMLIGGWIRIYQVPHEPQVYYDEYDWYNSARMIAEHKDVRWCKGGTFAECEYIEPSLSFFGFPFLWGQTMKLSGNTGLETGSYLNSVLSTLLIPAIYILAMTVTASPVAALFSSALLAFLPLSLFLAGSATYDTASFLSVCMFFTFTLLFMRNKSALSALAMLLLGMDMIIIRDINILIVPFIIIVFICKKTLDRKKWLIAIATLVAMALLLSPLLNTLILHNNIYTAHLDMYYKSDSYSFILKENLSFLLGNDFIPPIFLFFGMIGFALGRNKMGNSIWLLAYPLMIYIFLNVVRMEIWQGDFPRRLFSISMPILLLGGIGAEELLQRINNRGMQYVTVIVILACVVVDNKAAFIPSNPVFNLQHKYLSQYLQDTDPECSIFSVDPAIVLAYEPRRRTYRLDKLYDKDFLEKHKECKILLVEYMLGTNQADKVLPTYKPNELENIRKLFSFNPRHRIVGIYGVYDLDIVYLKQFLPPRYNDNMDAK